jgi:hypothetical protein
MVRSFDLARASYLNSPAKSHPSVCVYAPPSLYDTPELGEVKQIPAPAGFFSAALVLPRHKNRISGLLAKSGEI